ncbi:twin-arginine translocase subunit TatA [Lysobacteraceae bacterium NML120232]|nr:twin-arginine translocase subunit TatA [Xanthomonadaceae bacterium NML08-0793]PJK13593.1 twin-arginine translocase subunit TatA [Xanthomonadaceae bacterium NML120232]
MIGWRELLILLVIVVLIFGTKRLTSGMRDLGKGVREFKKGMKEPDEPQSLEDARGKDVAAGENLSSRDPHAHDR